MFNLIEMTAFRRVFSVRLHGKTLFLFRIKVVAQCVREKLARCKGEKSAVKQHLNRIHGIIVSHSDRHSSKPTCLIPVTWRFYSKLTGRQPPTLVMEFSQRNQRKCVCGERKMAQSIDEAKFYFVLDG